MSGRVVHYTVAAVLVRLADEGARVALTLLALQRTGSAAVGGALVAALLVPHVIAAPVVGLLTDRSRRPRLPIAASAFVFAIVLAATAVSAGRLPVWAVVAILLIGGCGGPALTGALSSQLPGLVGSAALNRAFGLDSLTYNLSGILGPAIAAVFSDLTSPATATCALAGAAALGAAAIATLPTAPPIPVGAAARFAADPTPADRVTADPVTADPVTADPVTADPVADPVPKLTDGIRAFVHDKTLAAVTLATSVGQLGAGALPVVAAVIAERHHDASAAGWLLTAFAAGGLAGSLLWTWRPASPANAARIVMAGLIGVGLPIAAAAATSSLPMIAAMLAVSGICNGPLFGALLATRQQCAPEQLRSQVFTLGAGAKITANAAGAALAGVVIRVPGPAQLVIVAACPLLAGALGLLRLAQPGSGRRLEATGIP